MNKTIYLTNLLFLFDLLIVSINQDCGIIGLEQNLITIAEGEQYDYYLTTMFVLGPLNQFQDPYQQFILDDFKADLVFYKSKKFCQIENDVIDIVNLNDPLFGLMALIKTIKDDQIVHLVARGHFNADKQFKFDETIFIIQEEKCYQLSPIYQFYFALCENSQNQIYLYFFSVIKIQLIENQQILLRDVIIPENSQIKIKKYSGYIGILISKGRIENQQYISEYSQLIFLYFTIESDIKTQKLLIMLFKQYEVLNRGDDFVTDFEIYNSVALITRFRGLSTLFLDVAWDEEKVIYNSQDPIQGIHIYQRFTIFQYDQLQIQLIILLEDRVIDLELSYEKLNTNQSKFLNLEKRQSFPLQSYCFFLDLKIYSSLQYLVVQTQEQISVFYVYRLVSNYLYANVINIDEQSRFIILDFTSQTLFYEVQTNFYCLHLNQPLVQMASINQNEPPKQFLITKRFDSERLCLKFPLYYQVQPLNAGIIWKTLYEELGSNTLEIIYSKNTLQIIFDLSKKLIGQALKIKQIESLSSDFLRIYTNQHYTSQVVQFDSNQNLQAIISDNLYACSRQFLSYDGKFFIVLRQKLILIVAQCQDVTYSDKKQTLCQNYNLLQIQEENFSNLVCEEQQNGVVNLFFIQKSFSSNKNIITSYNTLNLSNIQIFSPVDEGIILQIGIYMNIRFYTQLLINQYSINFIRSTWNSLDLNCFKLFEFVVIENYIYLPMIQQSNFTYNLQIEVYKLQDSSEDIQYLHTIHINKTDQPEQENLYLTYSCEGIAILWTTDTKQQKQEKKSFWFITLKELFRSYINSKFAKRISIARIKRKNIPTFELYNIVKLRGTRNYLYVYGSDFQKPASIYIYDLYRSQMNCLYYIIRTLLDKFEIFQVETVRVATNSLIYQKINQYLEEEKIYLITNPPSTINFPSERMLELTINRFNIFSSKEIKLQVTIEKLAQKSNYYEKYILILKPSES